MKVMDLLNLLSVAATSVFPMLWELSHRSRSTAVIRCEEVCARIDTAKIKRSKKNYKKWWGIWEKEWKLWTLHTVRLKRWSLWRLKRRRDILKVSKIMSEPEDPTQISLFFSHLPVSFPLYSAPPLSRSSKKYFALHPISCFPLISEPHHLISTFLLLYILFLMI